MTIGKPFRENYPQTQGFGENPASYAKFGLRGHDGIDFDLLRWVNFSVLSSGKNYQVFWSIISLGMVNMMDNFFWPEKPTNNFLHDQAVFSNMVVMCKRMIGLVNHNILALMSNSTFPMVVVSSPIKSSSTGIRTKSFNLVPPILKALMAKITVTKFLSAFIITKATTKPSFLAWGSLKTSFAYLTNVYHNESIRFTVNGVNNI